MTTKFIANVDCDCGDVRMIASRGRILACCTCRVPRYIDTETGCVEEILIDDLVDLLTDHPR